MAEIGDIFNVGLKFELPEGDLQFNVFDFILETGTATDAQVLTSMASLLSAAYGNLSAEIHTTVNDQTSIVNRMVWQATEWVVVEYIGTIILGLTPTNASDALPYQSSALVEFLTTAPRVTGKKYLPTFGEDRQDASQLIGAALTSMVSFGTQLLAPISCGNGFLTYCIRRKNGTTILPYGTAANGILSTQRRRKIAVGV